MTAPTAPQIDFEKAGALAELAFGFLGGAVNGGMIYLGDRLGLYQLMAGAGPLTSEELAAKAGLSERWVREWLRNQGGAGVLEYRGDGRFELSPEGALVFADESTPASAIGAFESFPEQFAVLTNLPEAFRTGRGYTYDSGGPGIARGVERMFGPWYRGALVSEALPKLPGVIEKLTAGAKAADVGCGACVADVTMAKAFPKSEFHGYDNSVHALARAEENKREQGVSNLTLHNPDNDPLPGSPTFDVVFTFDCLHDMARPDLVAGAIRKAIQPDGTWFIVDINAGETYEENLENPLSSMMYGFSIMSCMSSSASTPDGLALGTVGLPESKMRELVLGAGFSSFERVEGLEHPFNAYYLARP